MASSAFANAWSVLGYDGASMAKGGALTGSASGPAAVYYNIAGLAKPKIRQSVVSYIHGQPLLKLSPHSNPDAIDILDAPTHVYASGIQAKLGQYITLGVYGQYRHLQKTKVTKNRTTVLRQSNDADVFPDLDDDPAHGPRAEFSTNDDRLEALATAVDGVQSLNPGMPGYTLSGGYLSVGAQLTLQF